MSTYFAIEFSSLHLSGEPRIGPRVAAGCGDHKSLEVVVPAVAVRFGRLVARQVAMREAKPRPITGGHEFDLDRRRARRHRVRAGFARFPAPCEAEPVRR